MVTLHLFTKMWQGYTLSKRLFKIRHMTSNSYIHKHRSLHFCSAVLCLFLGAYAEFQDWAEVLVIFCEQENTPWQPYFRRVQSNNSQNTIFCCHTCSKNKYILLFCPENLSKPFNFVATWLSWLWSLFQTQVFMKWLPFKCALPLAHCLLPLCK